MPQGPGKPKQTPPLRPDGLDEPEDEGAEDVLLEALDALYELAEEAPEEALEMLGNLPPEVRQHREFQIAEAAVEKALGRLDAVVAKLRKLLEDEPEDPDLHYLLADALEDAGSDEEAQSHYDKTWLLDVEASSPLPEEVDLAIERAALRAIEELPEQFRAPLQGVPVFLAERPSREEVASGFDPRALGQFEGSGIEAPDGAVEPPSRIVLYTQNLASEFEGEELEAQVEITVLHELGHYFGLDEDDMVRLGLD